MYVSNIFVWPCVRSFMFRAAAVTTMTAAAAVATITKSNKLTHTMRSHLAIYCMFWGRCTASSSSSSQSLDMVLHVTETMQTELTIFTVKWQISISKSPSSRRTPSIGAVQRSRQRANQIGKSAQIDSVNVARISCIVLNAWRTPRQLARNRTRILSDKCWSVQWENMNQTRMKMCSHVSRLAVSVCALWSICSNSSAAHTRDRKTTTDRSP